MFEMRKQLRWSKLKVGVVVTLGLLILLIAVFFAGGIEKILSPKIEIKAQFQDVRGLRKGAPVWIFGTEVGSVKDIRLDRYLGAVVTISLRKDFKNFLKKDARATIMTMGLLGDKYIELTTGSPKADPFEDGDMIKGMVPVEISEIMETAGASIGKVGDVIQRLDNLILKIDEGGGTLSKFLKDPSIYDHLNRSLQTLSTLLEEVRTSEGTFRRLIEDPTLYQRVLSAVSSIEEVTQKTKESVEEIGQKVAESQGTFKRLLEDPSLYEKALATASAAEQVFKNAGPLVRDLEVFSRGLNEKTGTLRRMIEDPSLYDQLSRSTAHLSSILKRIDEGEGLAGALLKDQTLSKEMERTLEEFRGAALELRELLREIKTNPRRYLKFSLF
ncbi:MAG: MlaD family protein [Desulfobacterota bacterium]|nr:MlaD family protein [Thermodesulfobacteriota bacterium]